MYMFMFLMKTLIVSGIHAGVIPHFLGIILTYQIYKELVVTPLYILYMYTYMYTVAPSLVKV